jgi:hypothetical protein
MIFAYKLDGVGSLGLGVLQAFPGMLKMSANPALYQVRGGQSGRIAISYLDKRSGGADLPIVNGVAD